MDEGVDRKYVELAKRVDIFQGLRPSDVGKIFSRGMTLNVPKDQLVFTEKTIGNKMYVVLGGTFGIFSGDVQIATLHTGDSFGEMSLLLGESRSATVKAIESSKLFELDERIFQKLLTKRVAVQMLLNMSRTLARRLHDANKKIEDLESR